MQSYPSPNAVAADQGGPFYSSASNQQQQQSALPTPDDLQLTAQLSRGLAPIMTSGPGGNTTDSQDLRSQGQPNINHQYEQEHEHEQAHAAHIQANHGPMDQLGGQFGTPDGSMAPRKRSKVSRACDECRRKKIKCDATGEPGDDQCSSCKRVGTTCQFSRVPMKRGPSKGYIKELADRLNTLEGAIHGGEMVPQYIPQHDGPAQRRTSEEFSPPPNADTPRKRTYSAVSGGEFGSPYLAQRPLSNWNQQEPQRHLPQSAPPFTTSQPPPGGQHTFREPSYSANGLQPVPQWRTAPEPSRRQSNAFEGGPQDSSHTEHVADWDEGTADGYYKTIHSTYPILSSTKSRVLMRLAGCPPPLREAFFESLNGAVRSLPASGPHHPEGQSSRRAAQLITLSQVEYGTVRSFVMDTIYLQTMLLLAIEAENRPPTKQDQGCLSRSVWLGSAVGLAYSMKLHLHKQPDKSIDNDSDTDEMLGRRLWWSLVIMDRWHASSTSSPVLIPESSVVFYPEDQALLGDSLYHLARLSMVLGHVSVVTLVPTDIPAFGVAPGPIFGTLLRGELDRFRESLPASFISPSNAPLIHLCYWHLKMLVELTLPDTEPTELLGNAARVVTQLVNNSGLVTPLTYQSTTLVALALLDLTQYETTRDEAENGLKTLVESRIAPSSWDAAVRDLIANRKQALGGAPAVNLASVESKHASVASQSLQRLADLATATEMGRDDTVGEETKEGDKISSGPAGVNIQNFQHLREVVRSGYLSVFGGEAGR